MEKHQLPDTYKDNIQKWFLPLAKEIALQTNNKSGTFIVGVNGCQGSGKSTLSDFLAEYFVTVAGRSAVVMSLDDFYLDSNVRLSLSKNIHPLLNVRGVPGTHDTDQLKDVLSSLTQQGQSIIPRFNKAIDNPFPKEAWHKIDGPIDIVIMEGWCWGVTTQTDDALVEPVNDLEKSRDDSGEWRRYVNECLKTQYQPLYKLMDYWVMLKAPSFEQVFSWRCEQEHKLATSLGDTTNTKVMSDDQIWDFIQYYQRLTEHGLNTLPQYCNRVFYLSKDRSICDVKIHEDS